MAATVFDEINDYYNQRIAQFGYDSKSCDYGHSRSQEIKFDVIGNSVDFNGKSVLDVGCGFADFNNYLKNKFKDVHYTGVDITSGMVENAQKLNPGVDIFQKNILSDDMGKTFDVVTANGIFYLLGDNAQQIMNDLVTKMFELSSGVVIFNSLSTWAPDIEKGEFYADPAKTLEFCRKLTPWVSLRHDYHPRDFTVWMYKERTK
ncbi:MAG: class I SAM-dependent methyltransferase [Bacteroidetes bacterium]|nr:class I SAM-dependent methyltransferase [Bacteroidota bacterium]